MSKVIKFKKRKVEVNKNEIYRKNFIENAQRLIDSNNDNYELRAKTVFYGIRYINTINRKKLTYDEASLSLNFMQAIRMMIAQFTPNQFMQIFAPEKIYDGLKWGTKDYFSTMDELKKLGLDNVIGENVDDFLWCYHNWDINKFMVNQMCTISDIRKFQTGKSIGEEWAEEMGIQTYTTVDDGRGGTKFIKTPRKKGSHLKVVK